VIAGTTVITLNKGRDAHLARLLEGLARGPHPEACVVVEMGANPVPLPDLGFPIRRVHLEAAGLPLARARNAGRRAATTERLVFLDVDCIPSADLVPSLSHDLDAADGLICCEIRYLPAGTVADGWTEVALRAAGHRHPVRHFPERGLARAENVGLFWSLAFGVRATTFDRLGGFDEGFDGYGAEDTDLAFRADALGIPVLFTRGPGLPPASPRLRPAPAALFRHRAQRCALPRPPRPVADGRLARRLRGAGIDRLELAGWPDGPAPSDIGRGRRHAGAGRPPVLNLTGAGRPSGRRNRR
jgi:hypothetical protein